MRRCWPTIRQGNSPWRISLMTKGRETSRKSAACVVVISAGCGLSNPLRARSTAASSSGDTSMGTPLTRTSIRSPVRGALAPLAGFAPRSGRAATPFLRRVAMTLPDGLFRGADPSLGVYRPRRVNSTDEINEAHETANGLGLGEIQASQDRLQVRVLHPRRQRRHPQQQHALGHAQV